MDVDDDVAERMRGLLAERTAIDAVVEKRMFGGLAFMVGGHMAVCASGRGGVMVRVAAEATDDLIATTAAVPMVMRDRPVRGWVRVAAIDVEDDADLATWVDRGLATVRALPPKP